MSSSLNPARIAAHAVLNLALQASDANLKMVAEAVFEPLAATDDLPSVPVSARYD
jgi:hypothetical protein